MNHAKSFSLELLQLCRQEKLPSHAMFFLEVTAGFAYAGQLQRTSTQTLEVSSTQELLLQTQTLQQT